MAEKEVPIDTTLTGIERKAKLPITLTFLPSPKSQGAQSNKVSLHYG